MHLHVLDCSKTLASGTRISALDYVYGSQGSFTCSGNSKLFDRNWIYQNDSSTTCNKFAQWENSKDFQCRKGLFMLLYLSMLNVDSNPLTFAVMLT